MIRAFRRMIRRLLNRYPALVCRVCGHVVPFSGDRYAQADSAYLHFVLRHDDLSTTYDATPSTTFPSAVDDLPRTAGM